MNNQPTEQGRPKNRPQHGPEITLTDDERTLLTEAAARRGLTITAYIRMAAIDAALRDKERIGNQMSKRTEEQELAAAIRRGDKTYKGFDLDAARSELRQMNERHNNDRRGGYDILEGDQDYLSQLNADALAQNMLDTNIEDR